ncbi:MAG TPA: hypothetical protein VGH60_03860 [Solirubrobacteraceae bacterium]
MLLALCVAFAASPALAATSHNFAFAFGSQGEGAGQMSIVTQPSPPGGGIAVDTNTHDVYIADIGNRRIDEFSPTGNFVRAWGWGVATGAAELQVCTAICQVGLSGSEPGEFQAPTYIAVDNSEGASHGDVYVADTANALVTKFDGEGHLITSWGNNGEKASPNGQLNGSPTELFTSGFAGLLITGITVDASGVFWVYNFHERLFEFDSGGTWVATCSAAFGAGAGGGGISAKGGIIYAHDGNAGLHAISPTFNPNCTNLGIVVTGPEPAWGAAPDVLAGDIYVVRSGIFIEDIPASCKPSVLGCVPSQVFGEGFLNGGSGLAVDSSTSTVFVENSSTSTVAAFKIALEAITEPPSGISKHEATLHARVNPEGVELISCEFEFGKTAAYGSQVPCTENPGEIGEGTSLVPVGSTLSGLSSGTTYHFRLHARSSAGTVFSEDGLLMTTAGARVREVSAKEVSAAGVTLGAVVNPEGPAAKYHFEYGPCPAPGECVGAPFTGRSPEPDSEIPAGTSDVPVSQPVSVSLAAGATYHFRIVVNGEALSEPEAEGAFVFEPAAPSCSASRAPVDGVLSDCRAYELVTPPDKNGALVNNGIFIEDPSIAADGSRVLTQSLQCFDSSQSCTAIRQTEGSPFSFTRGETGWETQALLPSPTAYSTMLAYSASSNTVLLARSPQPGGLEELYARKPDGTLQPIGPTGEAPGPHIGTITTAPRVASSDLSHVVYQGRLQGGLWPALEGGAHGTETYAYPGPTNGRPALVGVTGGLGSTSLIGACGTNLGGTKDIFSAYNSLSADGRSTLFTVAPCSTGTGENAGKAVPAFTLYARVDEASEPRTVLVSGFGPESVCDSECREQPPRDASFAGASEDGSRVFFTDTGRLTNSATDDRRTQDSAFSSCSETTHLTPGCNLYEFACPAHCEHTNERQLVDVSAGDTSGLGPVVQGVMAIPPDGSDVFFVAQGVLTSTPNDMGRKASPGANNLYVYRFGPGGGEGSVGFIAPLSSADSTQWVSGIVKANVTPDGRFLVFTSHNRLTADVSREEGPAQVYRYDVVMKKLSRVSIGQAGFNDDGNASAADARILSAFHGFATGIGPGRADPTMSDSGGLVFFESPAGLTPGALDDHPVIGNPSVLAENIYEWAADGTQPSRNAPACAEPNGCVSLISDGRDLNEGSGVHENTSAVQLLGVDNTGANVFFSTADPLLPRDTDSQVDFYDARIGGGFSEPTEEAPCVTLDACHAPSLPSPVFGAPASASFLGAGNITSLSTVPSVLPGARRSLTRAERLAVALRACKKKRSRAARARCERQARKQYGGASRSRGRRTHR